MTITANPDIMTTPPAYHGAFDYDELARLGLSPDTLLDFSVNSNPYGPPPGVREALNEIPLERYPDRDCLALREVLADQHGLAPANIVVGNGTAELLQLIAFAFLGRGQKVALFQQTFSEYERVARLVGADVCRLPNRLTDELEGLDPLAVNARLLFLCNPNNPSGHHLPPSRVRHQWVDRYPHTLFVMDEAYANFLPVPQSIIQPTMPPNLLVLRSLTKDYALAGLRLGYAVGPPTLIEAVQRLRPAWNVNGLAQAAGRVVLTQQAWLTSSIRQLQADKQALITGLEQLGFSPLPSNVHYFLLNVGCASDFRTRLLSHQIMVRDCTSFGLPAHVRIATRTPADNQRLLTAIEQIQ